MRVVSFREGNGKILQPSPNESVVQLKMVVLYISVSPTVGIH